MKAICLLLSFIFPASALAPDKEKEPAKPPRQVVVPHWYGGLAIGQTIFSLDDEQVRAPGATQSTLNSGQNRTGYRVFGGYRLHRYVALEGALTDYGEFTATREISAPVS